MLVVVISEKNTKDVIHKMKDISEDCDIIEAGFDKFLSTDVAEIKVMREKIKQPVIFTLRPKHQGGLFSEAEDKRLSLLMQLGLANPDYIDFEYTIDKAFIEEFHSRYPAVKIIRSYHNFERTPQNLHAILSEMIHSDCAVYKIVTMANSSIDVLRMLHFVKEATKSHRIVGHCMGEAGIPSRVVAPILGSYFQYVGVSDIDSRAPGILSQKDSIDIYRSNENNSNTKIYAVLGDPIVQSHGHIFHNNYFRHKAINAVYVKFKVSSNELDEFFENIQGLPFHGLSVTMPLKKDILRFIDHFDNSSEKIGAINTLRINSDNISAINTDGMGAFKAIEKHGIVLGKKVLILGAGGSARAIAYEAKKRGAAKIAIINRTPENCVDLVKELECSIYDFCSVNNLVNNSFDIVFNTLPMIADILSDLIPKILSCLTGDTIVMDINYAVSASILVKAAQKLNCKVVDGYQMFIEQARLQQEYWL